MKQIERFRLEDGRVPFDAYLDKQPERARAKIYAYIDRVARGATSNAKRLKGVGGILEITIDWGPGYRVYYGEAGEAMILLLVTGTKKTQRKDIKQAQEYWRIYHETSPHL